MLVASPCGRQLRAAAAMATHDVGRWHTLMLQLAPAKQRAACWPEARGRVSRSFCTSPAILTGWGELLGRHFLKTRHNRNVNASNKINCLGSKSRAHRAVPSTQAWRRRGAEQFVQLQTVWAPRMLQVLLFPCYVYLQ